MRKNAKERDNYYVEFEERLEEELDRKGLTRKAIAKDHGIPPGTIGSWINRRNYLTANLVLKVAKALGTTVEYLIADEDGNRVSDAIEECIESDSGVYPCPFSTRRWPPAMARNYWIPPGSSASSPSSSACSAGRIQPKPGPQGLRRFYDRRRDLRGDLVVFVPGSIRGDGIYVLRVNDSLIVKRVEFDEVSRKLRIMSENERYPYRVESADG